MQKNRILVTYFLSGTLSFLLSNFAIASQDTNKGSPQKQEIVEIVKEKLNKKWLQEKSCKNIDEKLKKYDCLRCYDKILKKPWQRNGAKDLHQKVEKYLEGNEKQLIIVGAADSGKTIYSHFLQQQLWNNLSKKKKNFPIPIYVPLDKTWGVQDRALKSFLKKEKGLKEEEIDALKEIRTVFILDGYRHVGEQKNFYEMEFKKNNWNNSMVVITCRPELLRSSEMEYIFTVGKMISAPQLHLAGKKRLLLPMDDQSNEASDSKENELDKFKKLRKYVSEHISNKQQEVKCYEKLSWDMFKEESNFVEGKNVEACKSGLVTRVERDKFMFLYEDLRVYFLVEKILDDLRTGNIKEIGEKLWKDASDEKLLLLLAERVKKENLREKIEDMLKNIINENTKGIAPINILTLLGKVSKSFKNKDCRNMKANIDYSSDGISFTDMDLAGTNFEGADMTNGDLSRCNFADVCIADAILKNCNLTGAANLDKLQVNENTKIDYVRDEKCKMKLEELILKSKSNKENAVVIISKLNILIKKSQNDYLQGKKKLEQALSHEKSFTKESEYLFNSEDDSTKIEMLLLKSKKSLDLVYGSIRRKLEKDILEVKKLYGDFIFYNEHKKKIKENINEFHVLRSKEKKKFLKKKEDLEKERNAVDDECKSSLRRLPYIMNQDKKFNENYELILKSLSQNKNNYDLKTHEINAKIKLENKKYRDNVLMIFEKIKNEIKKILRENK